MCDATLHDGPLVCTRPDHADNGHTFAATWAADRRTEEVRDD